VAAGAVYAWRRGLSFVRGADYFAVALPLGHACGRIGCFLAGCCHGRNGLPVQLYEAAGLLAIALVCRVALSDIERGRARRGVGFAAYLVLYGVLRIALDPFRADGRAERYLGFSHQQLLALSVLVAGLMWWWLTRRGIKQAA